MNNKTLLAGLLGLACLHAQATTCQPGAAPATVAQGAPARVAQAQAAGCAAPSGGAIIKTTAAVARTPAAASAQAVAQASPSEAPGAPRDDSALLLVGLALMAGIALRRWGTGGQ